MHRWHRVANGKTSGRESASLPATTMRRAVEARNRTVFYSRWKGFLRREFWRPGLRLARLAGAKKFAARHVARGSFADSQLRRARNDRGVAVARSSATSLTCTSSAHTAQRRRDRASWRETAGRAGWLNPTRRRGVGCAGDRRGERAAPRRSTPLRRGEICGRLHGRLGCAMGGAIRQPPDTSGSYEPTWVRPAPRRPHTGHPRNCYVLIITQSSRRQGQPWRAPWELRNSLSLWWVASQSPTPDCGLPEPRRSTRTPPPPDRRGRRSG
jgi:hypothetical protein